MLKECRSHGYFREEFCPHCGSEGKFLLNDEEVELLGRTMAGVLRHFPERYGLEMDAHGWVDLRDFLTAVQIRNRRFRFVRQHHVVGLIETDPKGRYQFEDGKMRATYGHSKDIDLDLPTEGIPDVLYYPQDGPPERNVRSRPRGRPRPDRPTRDPRDRREDSPIIRRRDPQGRQDRVHVEGSAWRVPPPFASRGRGTAAGSFRGLDRLIFNRRSEYYSTPDTLMKPGPISSPPDG